MKEHRRFQYILNETDRELVDKETNGIQYIKRRTFKKAVDNGLKYKLVGRTRLRMPGQGKEDKYDLLQTTRRKYILDKYKYHCVKGYIPVGENRYVEYMDLWLPILWIILLGLLALLACLLLFRSCGQAEIELSAPFAASADDPDTESGDEEAAVEEPGLEVDVILPEGEISFEGTVPEPDEEPEASPTPGSTAKPAPSTTNAPTATPTPTAKPTPYTGQVHIKVTLDVDGVPHTLLNYDTDIQNGEIPDATLDFTTLDFELLPGRYEGPVYITFPDGKTIEEPITVVIRQSNSGSMGIGFSQEVQVDLGSGTVSCHYAPDSQGTHDTTVQLVLVREGTEYILAQSEVVHPGETLTGMTLDDSMSGRLQTGIYDGYLRLTFDTGLDENDAIPVTTDIEVSIIVQ